jgi:hypothetical protein
MLFKFMKSLGIEFAEQILFCHFLTNYRIVVHSFNAPVDIVSRDALAFHRRQAEVNSGSSSPISFKYIDLNDCLARCNSTRR